MRGSEVKRFTPNAKSPPRTRHLRGSRRSICRLPTFAMKRYTFKPQIVAASVSAPKGHRHIQDWFSMGITTFMRELIDPYWWTVALTSLVQFVLFVRWLYRRIRNDEMTRTFVEDMATSHLPHVYGLLEKLCGEKGIETPAEPPIRWVDLNGPHR
jgi:hypothetical protein